MIKILLWSSCWNHQALKCPIFFHKTFWIWVGSSPPRFTTMRLLFENGVLSFLSLQGAKAAVGNMLKTRRSKEKERATKILQFRKKSRIWRYRKYNSQENLVLLIVNDPKGMIFFDFRKDLLSLGILKKSQLPLALRFGSFKRNAQGWMIRCFQWNRGKTWYHPPIIQHRPREVPTDLKVWILFNLTSTSIQKLPFWEVSSNTLRGIWRLLLTPLIVGAPEVFLQSDNSSEPEVDLSYKKNTSIFDL